MGRYGPTPKKTANRDKAKRRTLPAKPKKVKVPALPKRSPAWLPSTRAWWKSVWSSPMAEAYLDIDRHTLLRIADLVDRLGRVPDDNPGLAAKLAGEIRLAQKDFGMTPDARDRMRWTVEEQAPPKRTPKKKPTDETDPRKYLGRDYRKEQNDDPDR